MTFMQAFLMDDKLKGFCFLYCLFLIVLLIWFSRTLVSGETSLSIWAPNRLRSFFDFPWQTPHFTDSTAFAKAFSLSVVGFAATYFALKLSKMGFRACALGVKHNKLAIAQISNATN